MKNVYGKNVLVTGATSGIGKEIAYSFAESGCNVIGLAIDAEEKEIKVGKGSIKYMTLDVTKEEDAKKVFKNIKSIDIAVLAAGFGIAGPAEIMPLKYVRSQMEVNYFGNINMCNNIIPIMRKNGHGLIIAISSLAGRVVLPMQSHYSSSKYALEAYMEALRMELKDFNIKTVLVEPGDIKTNFTKNRKTYNPEGNPYYDVCKRSVDKQAGYEQNGMSPKSISSLVIKMASKKNPPVRVTAGFQYKFASFLIRILPSKLIDKLLYTIYMPKK